MTRANQPEGAPHKRTHGESVEPEADSDFSHDLREFLRHLLFDSLTDEQLDLATPRLKALFEEAGRREVSIEASIAQLGLSPEQAAIYRAQFAEATAALGEAAGKSVDEIAASMPRWSADEWTRLRGKWPAAGDRGRGDRDK